MLRNIMKYIRLTLSALVAAALVATGCAVTEIETAPEAATPATKTVTFSARGVDTKTTFGEKDENGIYPAFWNEGDKAVISLNMATGVESSEIVTSEDFRRATFKADIETASAAAPYTFYAINPSAAVLGISKSHGGWKVRIPAAQTPLATSPDESAQIIVASEENSSVPDEVTLDFEHLTAYGRLSLTGLVLSEGETVTSVELELSEPWAGEFFYDYKTGALEDNGSSKSIVLSTSSVSDLWFGCAPVDASLKTLTATVTTNEGTYTKTVTFPANRRFTAGRVAKFSVSFAGVSRVDLERIPGKKVYRLVTDVASLEAGKEVLLVDSGASYAAGSGEANYRTALDVTVSKNEIDSETLDEDVDVYTLEKKDDFWSFKLGGQYLYGGTGSSNYLQLNSMTGAYTKWSVTIASNGDAIVSTSSKSGGSYRHIRYNSQDPRFSTYKSSSMTAWESSTQNTYPVCIYQEAEVEGSVLSHPILDEEIYGAYLSTGNFLYESGTDHLSREYSASTVDFAIISAPEDQVSCEFQGIPRSLDKGDSFTLRYLRKIGESVELDRNFEVTVLKIDGPKVWLESNDGNGFIIKK